MSTDLDDKEEYFLRASLLLLKGGGLMSKETLSREVQKAGINLDVLLKTNKSILKHKFSREQRNKLCLDGGTTCVDQWDLAMLTTVPLTVFKQSLNDDEKKALKCIKYKRDTVYAHTHSSVLSFDDYDDIRKELEEALGVLSNGLSGNVKDECAKIIQQCTTGPVNPSVKAELSKQLKGTEDLVKAVMIKLTDTHKAVSNMRNDIEDLKQLIIEDLGRHHATENRSLKKVTGMDFMLLFSPRKQKTSFLKTEEIILAERHLGRKSPEALSMEEMTSVFFPETDDDETVEVTDSVY
ncbi:uncharacterized protein LOC128553061 [Mercenaria mercenaria]|uniref:uncharacterized protein LOC128553061 n=1 Tax=Mercenaria mercenaria TaxID=6596 RepID=UPI00234F1AAA|nr:uncharacterized protein LOC128553061 [Mercenaria mercenaria]